MKNKFFLLLLIFLAARVYTWAAGDSGSGINYETVKIPAGSIAYELPYSSYQGVEYLKVPVTHKKDFYIGKWEVSIGQWRQCVRDGWCRDRGRLRPGETLDHPIVKVTWHDAYRFSKWISKKTGQTYRLPTEHEWYYAALEGKYFRAESKIYNYADINEIKKTPKITYKRGTFGENKWGMADIQGNVWEWTLACYALAEETLLQAQVGSVLNDPQLCATRITGGEHRAHVPDFIEDTYNGGCATLKPAANLGFRLVWVKDDEKNN